MKRIFSLTLILLLVGSAALAAVPDISGCSEYDLRQLYGIIRNYFYKNSKEVKENVTLVDKDNLYLYMTGDYNITKSAGYEAMLEIPCVLVNSNSFSASIGVYSPSVNGWDVYGYGTDSCAAGKKKKVTLRFSLSDADINTIDEIEDISCYLYTYNYDDHKIISVASLITFTCDSFK